VTRLALDRDLLVQNNGISVDQLARSVTLITSDAGVAARQRKGGAFVVVKRRRNPALGIVAIRTRRLTGAILELAGMRFRVARFAFQ